MFNILSTFLSSLILIISFSLFSSCSSLDKVAVSMTGGLIVKGMPENETEGNWEHFASSAPANIKFVESLLYTSPEDKNLLFSLTKSYGAYALLISETKLFNSEIKHDKDLEKNKKDAIYFYSKAVTYGLRLMQAYGISYNDLMEKQNDPLELHKLLNAHFDLNNQMDTESAFFFAQSMGGLINLQKNRPLMIAHLPLVKSIFDWICQSKSNFYYGSCQIFFGMYESSRPTLLGGNPEKGKEYFLKGIKDNPLNLFIKMSYIQYYLLPMDEKDEIKSLLKEIEDDLALFQSSLVWSQDNSNKFTSQAHLNLFNATTLKRWQTLKN